MIAGSRSMVMSRSSEPVSCASTMEPGRTCDAMSSTMPSGRGGGQERRPAEVAVGRPEEGGSDPVRLLHELGRALDLVPAARPVVAPEVGVVEGVVGQLVASDAVAVQVAVVSA